MKVVREICPNKLLLKRNVKLIQANKQVAKLVQEVADMKRVANNANKDLSTIGRTKL